ncbi:PREDICTED: uncharacterized protein LOC104809942 [Tarenaya hassleriana]|uniref:uncharacterized protein LOC104809942 n=1 Tax=Tarenaya hassleriana TaxID=28532 RepID=UPI00053C9A50|nr:PREDICTED: uncharacterized protein LOC104809942 [Tarenaya hassleriana]
MEEEMKKLTKSLGGFCNHLQSSCEAFSHSLQRRPIPLDSASSTFIQGLNRRLSVAGTDLNLLESMSFGTISFEELLGHCNQIFKKNHGDILVLQDRLTSFGYVPETETDDDGDVGSDLGASHPVDVENWDEDLDPPSHPHSIIKGLEEDSLLDESLSLKNLGLSDACLATLASVANDVIKEPDIVQIPVKGKPFDTRESMQSVPETSELSDEKVQTKTETGRTPGQMIAVSKEEYENLPPYMKCLAAWEDLLCAVEKMNSALGTKEKTRGCYYFRGDEIQTIGLGNKEKAYMLMLMRMNRLVVETTDGIISYRVV